MIDALFFHTVNGFKYFYFIKIYHNVNACSKKTNRFMRICDEKKTWEDPIGKKKIYEHCDETKKW